MTPKQRNVLGAIHRFTVNQDYSPTYQEVAVVLRLKSLATVHKHVFNLMRDGYLEPMIGKKRRNFELTEKGLKAVTSSKGEDTIRMKRYVDALIEIQAGLTTDRTSKHIARVALGWE